MDVDQIVRETGAGSDAVHILVDNGLELEQIVTLLTDPLAVMSWSTEFESSDNVVVEADGSISLVESDEGRVRPLALGQRVCGWAITKHDGSAWAIRTARLTLRTDWCWDQRAVLSHVIQHSVSATVYGTAGGLRVDPSEEGNSGWLSDPDRFRTEAKANWKQLPNGTQVQSGTAFARHVINSHGRVSKEQGGWPD